MPVALGHPIGERVAHARCTPVLHLVSAEHDGLANVAKGQKKSQVDINVAARGGRPRDDPRVLEIDTT